MLVSVLATCHSWSQIPMRLLCPCTPRLALIRLSLEFRQLEPDVFGIPPQTISGWDHAHTHTTRHFTGICFGLGVICMWKPMDIGQHAVEILWSCARDERSTSWSPTSDSDTALQQDNRTGQYRTYYVTPLFLNLKSINVRMNDVFINVW